MQAGEGGGHGVPSRPAGVDADEQSALAAGQPGGDVQQPVTQQPGLDPGQFAVEQGGLGPGEQVAGGQGQLQPAGIERELPGRRMVQPGVLGSADPVLDPSAGAVPGLQLGQLEADGVGGEGLEPLALRVGEAQLGAGMWAFPAHDHGSSSVSVAG